MFIVMHMILKLLLLCLLAIVCVMNLMEHDGLGFGSVIKEKKWKSEWELYKTFQDSWVAKFPWVELVKFVNDNFFMVYCKIYSTWKNCFSQS
jgi:hypothetical protein